MKPLLTSLIILLLSVLSSVFGEAKHEQWPEKSYNDVYNAILKIKIISPKFSLKACLYPSFHNQHFHI